MAVSDKHPDYSDFKEDWDIIRDAYKGQRAVKRKRQEYLPATAGQEADGMVNSTQAGYKAYDAYLKRTRFPGHTKTATQTAVGMMHSKPATIVLPDKMQSLMETATTHGESLQQLLRKINEQQVLIGRVGVLIDLPKKAVTGQDMPYIATYEAETIINWDDGAAQELTKKALNLVVLDESEQERSGDFSWTKKEKYRVLVLGEVKENEPVGKYKVGMFGQGDEFTETGLTTPSWRGTELTEIPFVFINSCDLVPKPDDSPLLDLVNLCFTIYRGEADYRQSLFMQGQDTLVIIGSTSTGDGEEGTAIRTGAGAMINVPLTGDAKYIGVDSKGLSEQREALKTDNTIAGSMGAQSIDTTSRERESGASLNTRIAARTADMNQIALVGAAGLEKTLKIIARWIGANPDEVKVTPNLDFGDSPFTGQALVELQTAKNQGAPISGASIHGILVEKGLTKLTFSEELAALEKEKDSILDKSENGDRNPAQVVK